MPVTIPDQSIALKTQTPNPFATLGNILDVANSAQNYQRGGVALQQERALLQPNIERGKAEASRAQTAATGAAFQLQRDQAHKAIEVAGGYLNDPRLVNNNPTGTIEAATEMRDQMIASGVPKDKAEWWTSQITSRAHQPGAAINLLRNVIRANAGAQSQANVVNNPLTTINTQQGTQFAQIQPGAPNAVTPIAPNNPSPTMIPAGVAPSATQTTGADALGRPILIKKDQSGKISYESPQGTNYKPLMQLPPGETAQTAAPLFQLRDTAQKEAALAPTQHFNNQQIIRLAPDAFTGTGSEALRKALGTVGIQNFNDVSSATSQLQHFMSLQIEANAAAQGANTDAARAIAASAVLPHSSPEQAIKNITRINDAYVTGKELFNNGLVKAINDPSNGKDIFAARDFQNQWSQNFDPNVMRIINAQKSGDTDALKEIQKELGSDGMKALIPKYLALKSLYETGHLPK